MFHLNIYFLIDKFNILTNRNIKITKLLKKNSSKVVILEKFIIFNKAVTLKEILSST